MELRYRNKNDVILLRILGKNPLWKAQ